MFWTLDIVWKATLVLGLAFAADFVLRHAAAAVRDTFWTLAFASLLALPLASVLAPSWSAPVDTSFAVYAVSAEIAAERGTDWALWIWTAGVAVAALRLVIAHLRAALLVRRSRPNGARLRESAPGSMPLTWGLLRPLVVLPSDAVSWPESTRQSVLRHEAAHISRGDLWKQLLAQLVCCAFWFHPLAWMAAARAAQIRERACDDAVLSAGAEASDYAGHLLDVARRVRPLSSAAAMTYCSELEGRLMAILDSTRKRTAAKRSTVFSAAALAGLLIVTLAGLQLGAEEVYRLGDDGVTPPKLIHKVEPQYTEDARDAGIEGRVVLTMQVSSNGEPEKIQVRESLDPGLDTMAMEAVSQWRFEPGKKDGEPVRIAAMVEVNFRLK